MLSILGAKSCTGPDDPGQKHLCRWGFSLISALGASSAPLGWLHVDEHTVSDYILLILLLIDSTERLLATVHLVIKWSSSSLNVMT